MEFLAQNKLSKKLQENHKMAFFAADENFLELTVNKTNANRQNGMNIGPIKFNMTTRNSNLAQQEKDGLSEFFQETHESRPISYHKFPNYSIIEADPKTTGISKLLKIDFVNSKISEIDHVRPIQGASDRPLAHTQLLFTLYRPNFHQIIDFLQKATFPVF